jgi:hypothetical protein
MISFPTHNKITGLSAVRSLAIKLVTKSLGLTRQISLKNLGKVLKALKENVFPFLLCSFIDAGTLATFLI